MDEPRELALSFLKNQGVLNLACISGDKPIASAVAYHIDNQLNVYFATKDDTYKAKAMKANPNVSISVWQYNQFHFQATGQATVITDHEEGIDMFEKIVESSMSVKDFWPPILSRDSGEYLVFQITLTWARLTDFRNIKILEKEMPYYQII